MLVLALPLEWRALPHFTAGDWVVRLLAFTNVGSPFGSLQVR
jgi:hypothetical protein